MTTSDRDFPKRIFVQREGEEGDAYLAVSEDLDALDDENAIVAVYELRAVKRVQVTRELIELVEGESK